MASHARHWRTVEFSFVLSSELLLGNFKKQRFSAAQPASLAKQEGWDFAHSLWQAYTIMAYPLQECWNTVGWMLESDNCPLACYSCIIAAFFIASGVGAAFETPIALSP